RESCLESECKGPMVAKRYPRIAKLKSVFKLPLKKRFTSNFELLEQGRVLLVDSEPSQLKPGIRLEGVIRRLDYEGKEGLILYGIAYRPLFREAYVKTERAKPIPVVQAQYA